MLVQMNFLVTKIRETLYDVIYLRHTNLCTKNFPSVHKFDIGKTGLLQLLLGAEVIRVTTFGLAAISGTWMEPGVTLTADHLVAVVLLGQDAQRGLNDTASQTEHQMQRRLLLYIVIGESAAVLQLLPGKYQPLLVGRDTLLVLNLGLHILDRVGGLDLERDGLSGESFHKNLHGDECLKRIRMKKTKFGFTCMYLSTNV